MNRRATWLQALDAQLEQDPWFTSDQGFETLAEVMVYADGGRMELDKVAFYTSNLLYAEPVFVTAEMCDVIDVAHQTFQPEPFEESDLLTPIGFLLFERPIELTVTHGGNQITARYVGFAWAAFDESDETQPFTKGVGLTFYVDAESHGGEVPGWPDMRLFEQHYLGFGVSPASPEHREAIKQYRLAGTTFRLMREFKPASRYSMKERPDRATRKRARRAGLPEREVLVVQLRREHTPSERLTGTIDYAYRFMVSGHWRNQWFPSLHRHRQVWVSPYVKGPNDKPFKPPQRRVFNFYR